MPEERALPRAESRHEPLVGFVVLFPGHYVGGSALVYAHDREHAKRLLRDELAKQRIGGDPDWWVLDPITPIPERPLVRVYDNGDY